jgi:hypothetical protein
MPAVSEKQRRYLYARFGKEWVKRHHFDVVRAAIKERAKKRVPKK